VLACKICLLFSLLYLASQYHFANQYMCVCKKLQAVQANLVLVRALIISVACVTKIEKLIASLQHDLHQLLVRSECAQSEVPSIACMT